MTLTLASARTIHVIQGDCVVSADPGVMLTTILGSCVSACLFDPARGIGGMNHFLLPEAGSVQGDNRYAAAAMEQLLNRLLQQGARRAGLQAKLFGGARVVRGLSDIGAHNALAARQFLLQEGLPLITSDLCGDLARRIRFWPHGGRVQVERVEPAVLRAPEVPSRLRTDDIELF